jgi:transketolase C-terminal domain/subunit
MMQQYAPTMVAATVLMSGGVAVAVHMSPTVRPRDPHYIMHLNNNSRRVEILPVHNQQQKAESE